MKSTEYLYGVSLKELPSMEEGYRVRIDKSQSLLEVLLKEPLATRDTARVNAVVKAINHNTKLMKGEI